MSATSAGCSMASGSAPWWSPNEEAVMAEMDDRLKDARRRMEGAVAALGGEFNSVRTGRASTALLDRVTVDAYGTRTPLNQLATIHAPEPRLLTIQPFDRTIMQSVEKAIMESDLGLTPNNDGQTIRLAIPQLTEER